MKLTSKWSGLRFNDPCNNSEELIGTFGVSNGFVLKQNVKQLGLGEGLANGPKVPQNLGTMVKVAKPYLGHSAKVSMAKGT